MTDPVSKATLYRKIAAVAGAIDRVGKDGYNPQLKYKYATPATIMEAVKPLLAEQNLAIVPMMHGVIKEPTGSKTQSGAEKVLTRVEMNYVIIDGETGESLSCAWVGEGEDWSDKGIAKAQTIALRTFLIQLFQIPSGDEETDADASHKTAQRGATYDTQQSAKLAPTAPPQPAQHATAPVPQSREDWVSALRSTWAEENERGGFVPANELAIDLNDPADATIERIKELGKKSKARIIKLRNKELQPA